MGRKINPRIWRSGPYKPTYPRSGGEGDNVSWRKSNFITRGRDGHFYEEVFSGLGALNETPYTAPLTGTIAISANATLVTGTGTLFLTECHLGQRIRVVGTGQTHLIVPRRIISNTSMVVWRGPDATVTGATAHRLARLYAVDNQRGTSLWGNVVKLSKGNFLGVGDGIFRLDGQPLPGTTLTLSRRPAIAILNPTTGNFTPFELGMDTPDVSAVVVTDAGSGRMQAGQYSIVITPSRADTLGYNNPSERIVFTLGANGKPSIPFPAMDTASGQDGWILWGTLFSETLGAGLDSLNGPWFRVARLTIADVAAAGGTYTTDWLDAEIEVNETVTFNNDPPTDAEFVLIVNNIPVWISCQGQGFAAHPAATSPGPFIVPAKPSNIEAAPLELAFSTVNNETIIGAVSAEGRIYLLTPNHLQIAQPTPSDIAPVIIRPFGYSGFANPEQVVFVSNMLYQYSTAGPACSSSEGDRQITQRDWAEDIAEITLGWNPGHVMMAHDPFNDAVVLFHTADRRNAAGFLTTRWVMVGLSQGFWIGDGEFSSNTEDQIVHGVATIGDYLELLIAGGS